MPSFLYYSHFTSVSSFSALVNKSLHLPTFSPVSSHFCLHGTEPCLKSCQLCNYPRIFHHLMEPKFHYHVRKSPPLVPIMSQIKPVYTMPSYLRSILILSTRLRLGFPNDLLTFLVSHNYPICIPLHHLCYMSCPSHPP
jgi:hypothetical protein